MKNKITWKDSFDLDRRKTDYDIINSRGNVTLVNNSTNEKLSFPNQICALNHIKKINSIK